MSFLRSILFADRWVDGYMPSSPAGGLVPPVHPSSDSRSTDAVRTAIALTKTAKQPTARA